MDSSRRRRAAGAAVVVAAGIALAAPTAMADDPQWIRQLDSSDGISRSDIARAVAADARGNVLVVGDTGGALGGIYKGNSDSWLAKFDGAGTLLWTRQPGTSAIDAAKAVATDADGSVYVVGDTDGALGGVKKGSQFDTDAFVIKFDADGHYLWKRQPGTAATEYAAGVTTDTAGNVYVVGTTGGALGGPLKWGYDAFVIKYDTNGQVLWKRQPGSSDGTDYASGVTTDAAGNVFVVGFTTGTLGGTHVGGEWDAWIVKFDADGHWLWKRQPGTVEDDYAEGVAADAAGDVYLAGSRAGVGLKGRLLKFDGDGRRLWEVRERVSTVDGVAADTDGTVYLVGSSNRAVGGPNQGLLDAWVIRFDGDGHELWKAQLGTSSQDTAAGIATDADGNVFIAGYTFGSFTGTHTGDDDAFIAEYAPVPAP